MSIRASPSAVASATTHGARTAPTATTSDTAAPAPTVRLDAPYWATPQPIVEKMLELAGIKASDVVYDLGCGDARIVVTAAQRYGVRGYGFDIDPRRVVEAQRNVRRNGVEHLVQIEQADIFTLDLAPADVIFLFLFTRLTDRLTPQLEKLRPGSRIVSHEFEIPRARPTKSLRVLGPPDGPPETNPKGHQTVHALYLWKMPWQRRPEPADFHHPCWSGEVPTSGPCAPTGQ
jgi:SAM-dependent methyltransferase